MVLYRGDRLHAVGAADGGGAGLRQAKVLDLAFGDEVPHGAGDILDRHAGIDAMLVEQVDAVGPQPFQGRLDDGADVLRPAVQSDDRAVLVKLEAKFAGNHHLVAHRLKRFADEKFVGEGAVAFGGIEERDAALEGGADHGDAVFAVGSSAEAKAQAHAAQPEGGYGEAGLAKLTCFHSVYPFIYG